MLFNSIQFWVFFLVVWAAVWRLRSQHQLTVLLGASLIFYGLWVPIYLLLLLFTIGLNFVFLQAMVASPRPRRWLAASIIATLGMLGYFKYGEFFVVSIAPLLEMVRGQAPAIPDILLPLGISFYSFQIIAVSVDTYRGQLPPIRSFGRYALFVCFFPQLIAGPIVRGADLLPQLERGPVTTPRRTRRGAWLIASGLAKKVLFADYLLAHFVATSFNRAPEATAPILLIATYSFAFQIYFDFSGYTDIARGLALLLGFELPFNFKEPYLSRSPSEFWRRWHITLSTWLRDYLYIPLGGNRHGRGRTAANLMITMLLGGLWHGASWTFVVWGALHGLLLVAQRALTRRREAVSESINALDVLRIVVLFHLVCLFWVFFRADSFAAASVIIARITGGDFASEWPIFQVCVVVLCAALHPLERLARLRSREWQAIVANSKWGPLLEGAVAGVLAALCVAASSGGEFIYFQF